MGVACSTYEEQQCMRRYCEKMQTADVRVTQQWGALVQPLLQWKRNECYTTWVCICSLTYPACNAHAPYFQVWPAPARQYFSTLSYKWQHLGGGELFNIKCVFFFNILLTVRLNIYIFININQLDALNFIIRLFQASTCFEHMCSSSGGQNCTIHSLVSSHL